MIIETRGDAMVIKIIGSNCSNGIKLKKMLERFKSDYDYDVNIKLLDNMEEIKSYKIKNIPGLVIEDQLVSEGKVLTVREISRLVNEVTPA
jgi:ribosomal protein S17E